MSSYEILSWLQRGDKALEGSTRQHSHGLTGSAHGQSCGYGALAGSMECLTLPRTVCLLSSQGHAAVVVMKNLHSKLEGDIGTAKAHAACHVAMWQIDRTGLGKADLGAVP